MFLNGPDEAKERSKVRFDPDHCGSISHRIGL